MKRFLGTLLKKEPVFLLAFAAAALSALGGAPLSAYPGYMDGAVLMLLFCLMAVASGMEGAGVFGWAACMLPRRFTTCRSLGLALTGVCFFGAMLFTNDVALIAFVPLALLLFDARDDAVRALVICIMAVAANLGSLATPVGNPQNLFLYSWYQLDPGDFFAVTAPLGAVSLALCVLLTLLLPKKPVYAAARRMANVNRPMAAGYSALFALCLCAVFRVIPAWVCLAAVALSLAVWDRPRFKKVDWFLLGTFVCFFIFSGNLQRIGAVRQALGSMLAGRECLVSALCAQVISNVPAAVLLAPFTQNARGLLLGVNIGGLGTPVASLASLIAYKFYARAPGAQTGRYLRLFLAINAVLLAVLLLLFAH